jgi:hypothetical protein
VVAESDDDFFVDAVDSAFDVEDEASLDAEASEPLPLAPFWPPSFPSLPAAPLGWSPLGFLA